ncbi:MAG: rane metalloprotease [Evtepia sp.]|jgi:Zn-dependent protease|nr:rane metalloprotease [Evtepia sp.]
MQGLVSQLDWNGMLSFTLRIAAVLICIMIHEVSHGLAAYWLGDPTAKESHRLSFNPIHHIDPFGLLMMITVGFGWAKPVPIDARYFKNQKSGMAITAFAGPFSNFVLAFLTSMLFQAVLGILSAQGNRPFLVNLADFLGMVIILNIGLGIFNLIPFPPLDGSKILGIVLPERLYFGFMRYERYGMLLLVLILWFGVLDAPLSMARDWTVNLFLNSTAFMQNAVISSLR